MTREIALHCMKSASELERELCEECPIYGQTGCDHCYEDALQYVIAMLEQEPTTKNCRTCKNFGSHHGICEICKDNKCWTEIEPTKNDDVVALNFSDDIDTPNKYQTSDGKWHEGRIPTTKNDLGVDCISRKAALDITWQDPSYSDPLNVLTEVRDKIRELPSVTPQEPQSFKWCTDCKEYNQEKHCCHRYSKAIRDAVAEIEQEPILDKINKMKSEIADSLEFWDYSPNNNPLARDMLETLTNFWGDMREVKE